MIIKTNFSTKTLKMAKEKKNQKKKNTKESATADESNNRFGEACITELIFLPIESPNTTTFTTC
jgi:hypothetical protein